MNRTASHFVHRFLVWLALACLPLPLAGFPVERCMNLSNALEAPREGDWGYVILRDHLERIRAAGFDTIRLPVRFSHGWHGRIDPALLARVDEVIGWAFDENLTVVLDLHHFDALTRDPDGHRDTFLAIWDELSAHYAGAPDDLIFELLNEPADALTTRGAIALYRQVVPRLREDHPDRWIVISGGKYAALDQTAALPRLDDRIVRSFHYYRPWTFTHQEADFLGDPPARQGWGSAEDHARLDADFDHAGDLDGPRFLGEFGVYGEVPEPQRTAWIRAVRQASERHGIGWCHWGFAAQFSAFDPETQTWRSAILDALFE